MHKNKQLKDTIICNGDTSSVIGWLQSTPYTTKYGSR